MGVHGVAVERIFPFYSPLIDSIRLINQGHVRRSRIYYLRDRVGRAARIEEKRIVAEVPAQEVASETNVAAE
jgi:large subunit ribosomal protein L19